MKLLPCSPPFYLLHSYSYLDAPHAPEDGEQTPRPTPPALAENTNTNTEDLYLNERPPSPALESHVDPSVIEDDGGGDGSNAGGAGGASSVSTNPLEGEEETPQEEGDGESAGVEDGDGEVGEAGSRLAVADNHTRDDRKETSAYPSPPPSEPCCDSTPKASPTVKSGTLPPPKSASPSLKSEPVSLKSVISAAPSGRSRHSSHDVPDPEPASVPKEATFSPQAEVLPVLKAPSWQGIYSFLVDSITALPNATLRNSLETYNKTGELDEVALSIWTLQSHKRFLRGLDPIYASNPKRLFIPPNTAQAIESALMNGYRNTACNMLHKLWQRLNPSGSPEHLVVLMNKNGHWVVHW